MQIIPPPPKPTKGISLKDLKPYALAKGQFLSSENLKQCLTNYKNQQNEEFI